MKSPVFGLCLGVALIVAGVLMIRYRASLNGVLDARFPTGSPMDHAAYKAASGNPAKRRLIGSMGAWGIAFGVLVSLLNLVALLQG